MSLLCALLLALADDDSKIVKLDPPESGFYAKMIDYEGVPIKASDDVADAALVEARNRLARMLGKQPDVRANLATEGAELHLIGKDQVTSDLPEHRHLKGKPFEGKLTVDQRTRGLGGLVASCGEENLLRLRGDRYQGRDICVHEFAHTVLDFGMSPDVRKKITAQYRKSTDAGLWKNMYAGSNAHEYFAELTMWYFGTRGDYGKLDPPPLPGPEWLKSYDPDGFAVLDDFYSGRLAVARHHSEPLDPLPPSREGTLKSLSGGGPTTLRLVNKTNEAVQLFWLDFDGKRQKHATIPPHGHDSRGTFGDLAWLLTDDAGKALTIFVARANPGTGVWSGAPASR